MANGKNTIKSIPLNAQLNMTKNQSRISTSFDQFNNINSPVYDGNIAPLHRKLYKDGVSVLFDRKANDYYFDNHHFKSDSLGIDVDLSDKKYFETGIYTDADIDGLVFDKIPTEYSDAANKVYNWTTAKNIAIAWKVKNGNVELYWDKDEKGKNLTLFNTLEPIELDNGTFQAVTARVIIPYKGTGTKAPQNTQYHIDYDPIGDALLFVIFQNTKYIDFENGNSSASDYTNNKALNMIGVFHISFNEGMKIIDDGYYSNLNLRETPLVSKGIYTKFCLSQYKGLDVAPDDFGNSIMTWANISKVDQVSNDFQIIVSSQNFSYDDKVVINANDNIRASFYGITILNKKHRGVNARTDFTYWNGIYFESQDLEEDYYGTASTNMRNAISDVISNHGYLPYWNLAQLAVEYNMRIADLDRWKGSFAFWVRPFADGGFSVVMKDEINDKGHFQWGYGMSLYINPGHWISNNQCFSKDLKCIGTTTSTASSFTRSAEDSLDFNAIFTEGTNTVIALAPNVSSSSYKNADYEVLIGTVLPACHSNATTPYDPNAATPGGTPTLSKLMCWRLFSSSTTAISIYNGTRLRNYCYEPFNEVIENNTLKEFRVAPVLTPEIHSDASFYRSNFIALNFYGQWCGENQIPTNTYGTAKNTNIRSGTDGIITTDNTTLGVLKLCANDISANAKMLAIGTSSNKTAGFPTAACSWTVTTNQYYNRLVIAGPTAASSSFAADVGGNSILWDSATPEKCYLNAGMTSTQAIPTTAADWTVFFENSQTTSSKAIYNPTGSIAQIPETNFRLLFNYREGYISGISYGESGKLGYLLTEWDSVDDSFMVTAVLDDNEEREILVYRNSIDGKLHYVQAKRYADLTDSEAIEKNAKVFFNRYVLLNANIENNCYDFIKNEWETFALDWNNRLFLGWTPSYSSSEYYMSVTGATVDRWTNLFLEIGDSMASRWYQTATEGSGYKVSYETTDSFSPSRLLPYNILSRVVADSETLVSGRSETIPIDYFFSGNKAATTVSAPSYKTSFNTSKVNDLEFVKSYYNSQLEGSTFPVSSTGTQYNNFPIVGVDFITSYNGKYGIKIDKVLYTIVYDGIRPIALYNTTSMVENADVFFIVQGQYYGVINDYICALSYSTNNVINNVEQIVNVNGMKFIGAFPSVAYFWSNSTKAIYAFTGDADMQLFVQSGRINTVNGYLYSPSKEWIYLATDDGLYIFSQNNVFKVDLKDITALYSTDKDYDVITTKDGFGFTKTWFYALKHLPDFEAIPIEIETEFFGPGDFNTSVVDCWPIRLYKGDEADNGKVCYTVKVLTDKITEIDKKEISIKPKDWDANDNYFLRVQPAGQRGEGISLKIKSDYPISMIGCAFSNDAQSHSKFNL